MLYCWCFWKR